MRGSYNDHQKGPQEGLGSLRTFPGSNPGASSARSMVPSANGQSAGYFGHRRLLTLPGGEKLERFSPGNPPGRFF